jgi:parvulin-like peptidyl-prolyl isomerase
MVSLSEASIQPEALESFLKKNLQLKEIYRSILQQVIVDKTARERGISVTPEEIQDEANCMRRKMRLEKASDTFAWLSDQMLTPEDWEAGIRDRILTKKLSEHLFSQDIKKHFAEHKLDFEQILLYQIVVPYERVAQELFYQIEEEEISFYEAAHLYDIDEKRRYQCGCEGKIPRWSLLPEIATAIFSEEPGQLIGPVKTELGYHLFKVEEIIKPELTPELHQEILDNMFRKWVEGELNYLLHHLDSSDSFFLTLAPAVPNAISPNRISEKRLEDSGIMAI